MIAYEEYLVKGFALDVNDYRIKPVSFERFRKTIDKNFDYLSAQVTGEKFANKLDSFFIKTP